MNSIPVETSETYFNFTIGFRHDSPTPSPYGYTVKLANPRKMEYLNQIRKFVLKKTKSIAWFVSHCVTESKREDIVKALQVNLF